jgi:hypothetical protein
MGKRNVDTHQPILSGDLRRSREAVSPDARGAHMRQPVQTRRFKEALERVQLLFIATRSVKLTNADAARMAGLDRQVCRVLLQNLIETGFLEQHPRGMFARSPAASHVPFVETASDPSLKAPATVANFRR